MYKLQLAIVLTSRNGGLHDCDSKLGNSGYITATFPPSSQEKKSDQTLHSSHFPGLKVEISEFTMCKEYRKIILPNSGELWESSIFLRYLSSFYGFNSSLLEISPVFFKKVLPL